MTIRKHSILLLLIILPLLILKPETGMWDENTNANEVQKPIKTVWILMIETNIFINTNARITWSINNDLRN